MVVDFMEAKYMPLLQKWHPGAQEALECSMFEGTATQEDIDECKSALVYAAAVCRAQLETIAELSGKGDIASDTLDLFSAFVERVGSLDGIKCTAAAYGNMRDEQ